MVWEIMARKLPFSHLPNPKSAYAVLGAAEQGELLGKFLPSAVSYKFSEIGIRPPIDAVRPDCWEGIKHLIQRCWNKDPALRPSMQKVERYLGKLGASVNYKDFVQVLDDVTMAVVTFHAEQGPSGWRRYVRVEFWRKQIRAGRLTFSMIDFNQTGKNVLRESIRALKDANREVARVEEQVEREASRVYQNCERETRVAVEDVVRETGRAAEDVVRETGRATEDVVRETGRVSEDVVRETGRASEDVAREAIRSAQDAEREAKRIRDQLAIEAQRLLEEKEAQRIKNQVANEAKRTIKKLKKLW